MIRLIFLYSVHCVGFPRRAEVVWMQHFTHLPLLPPGCAVQERPALGCLELESGEGIWSLENNSSGRFYCWKHSDLPYTAAPLAVVCRVQAIRVCSTLH
ncbi:MAG: hypothetical protein EZS28_023871 [Streblomastix strix]|uniref:Uncharacterized protein n=1 Tax=Streblomastix strix TaxID=222440 RepID=A0A5J4VDL7_9EUKA|nr:MAG: hypothetical protein EZS28_023871 [Streblomastix strix]